MPRFGQAQIRCKATQTCVKCAGDHHILSDQPAVCVNYGGQHPASYPGCPKFPKLKHIIYARALAPSTTPLPVNPALIQTLTSPIQTSSPPSQNATILENILNLLQAYNSEKVNAVIEKIAIAIVGKTTVPEIITALLSCAVDVITILKR